MKYEFHVGDYVETKTGTIGYVSEVPEKGCSFWTATKLSDCDINDNCYTVDAPYPIFSFGRFNRIGQYDFTKKDAGKIEPLDYTERFIRNSPVDTTLISCMKKINELVDAVNDLGNKRDEHESD